MILGILQARTSSSRLPGKVLLPLLGEPMLARQVERLRRCQRIDQLILATSDDASDDALAELAGHLELPCYRGSLNDVLDRFYQAAVPWQPTHVVRLTGDCPLADPAVIDACIDLHLQGGYDYTSNCLPPTFPDGLDVEVVRFPVLETAWREAARAVEREHVTYFIHQQPSRFKLGNLAQDTDQSALRWTVDEPEDFMLVSQIYQALYPTQPAFDRHAVLGYLSHASNLQEINSGHARNAGLQKSLAAESAADPDH